MFGSGKYFRLTWGQDECWRWSAVAVVPTPGFLVREFLACRCLRVHHRQVRSEENQGWAAARRQSVVCDYCTVNFYITLTSRCWVQRAASYELTRCCTFCGASCSGTSQSSSEAAGSCMPSNCLSKPMATDSAELDWRKDGELEIHTGYIRHTWFWYCRLHTATLRH